jgi:hypothetical protein
MNRTIGYWIENLLGHIIATIVIFIVYKNWSNFHFIYSSDFLDKVISISTTLFGFLLAVLTLIIQSNSPTVNTMRTHGSYQNLIKFNRRIVIYSFINCITSLVLCFMSTLINDDFIKYISIANIFIFIVVIINTILFTSIFYKIVINN